ncbi:pyridoxamine 5'-phosphate oxidase family protein [Methylopila sp. M107]|uniref:pyridoxamine 5'-phosphate oxidase family protein n=1 Tax=Methylopila sp. M107 TaxID=1101190 RepID=UPI00036EB173|nr:pyridoxamine 5'-phosphate oxidase family protein [Methylopila sp. M107]
MDAIVEPRAEAPWHAGELALQRSVGAAEKLDLVGRLVIRDHLVDQHRAFFPELPFVVAGAVDPDGDAWATLIAGRPGFLSAPDETALRVSAPRDPSDPADAGLEDGDAVGLLGLQFETRRRNRLNGTVRRSGHEGFEVAVEDSFGNCPKYIRQRDARFVRDPETHAGVPSVWLGAQDDRARRIVERADTFFLATYADFEGGARQVDVSHRGGLPGFVRIGADGALTIPDLSGNRFFNSLGNVLTNGRAGLLFVDFETGDLLQMTGDAELILDGPEIAGFDGAERLLRVRPRRIALRPEASPLRWTERPDGVSPNLQRAARR